MKAHWVGTVEEQTNQLTNISFLQDSDIGTFKLWGWRIWMSKKKNKRRQHVIWWPRGNWPSWRQWTLRQLVYKWPTRGLFKGWLNTQLLECGRQLSVITKWIQTVSVRREMDYFCRKSWRWVDSSICGLWYHGSPRQEHEAEEATFLTGSEKPITEEKKDLVPCPLQRNVPNNPISPHQS